MNIWLKMNSLKNEYLAKKHSFDGKCEILRTISQPRKLSADIPARIARKGFILIYNPLKNFNTFQHAWLTVLPAPCFQVRLEFFSLSSMLKLHENGWISQ